MMFNLIPDKYVESEPRPRMAGDDVQKKHCYEIQSLARVIK